MSAKQVCASTVHLAQSLSEKRLLLTRTQIFYQASKVTVLGGAGGIGQPLSLLMKLNPRVTELALYDIKGAPGQRASFYSN